VQTNIPQLDPLAVSMQKKPHAKVAKAAKTQAANVARSPVLHSLFG